MKERKGNEWEEVLLEGLDIRNENRWSDAGSGWKGMNTACRSVSFLAEYVYYAVINTTFLSLVFIVFHQL